MEHVYVVAVVVGVLIFILVCACIYVIAKGYRKAEADRAEQKAFYSDPELAKMEYDIAFYDEETAAKLAASAERRSDAQVTIEEVLANASEGRTAEEDAVFNKTAEGMEEISGSFEPEKEGDE